MYTRTPTSAGSHHWHDGVGRKIRRVLFRKLWLPRFVYEILPYVYMAVGFMALYAATQTPDWTWILPYVVLLGLICLHAGLGLVVLRHRFRHGRRGPGKTL